MQLAPVIIKYEGPALNGHARKLRSIADLTIAPQPVEHLNHQGSPKILLRLQGGQPGQLTTLVIHAGLPGPDDLGVSLENLASEAAGERWSVGTEGPDLAYTDPAISGAYGDWNVTGAYLVWDNAWGAASEAAVSAPTTGEQASGGLVA
jgi:hypothetical protein